MSHMANIYGPSGEERPLSLLRAALAFFFEGAPRKESKILMVLHVGDGGAAEHPPSSGVQFCTECYK